MACVRVCVRLSTSNPLLNLSHSLTSSFTRNQELWPHTSALMSGINHFGGKWGEIDLSAIFGSGIIDRVGLSRETFIRLWSVPWFATFNCLREQPDEAHQNASAQLQTFICYCVWLFEGDKDFRRLSFSAGWTMEKKMNFLKRKKLCNKSSLFLIKPLYFSPNFKKWNMFFALAKFCGGDLVGHEMASAKCGLSKLLPLIIINMIEGSRN